LLKRNLVLTLLAAVIGVLAFPNPWVHHLRWQGGVLAFFTLVPLLAVREPRGGASYWRWGYLYGVVYYGLSILWMSAMPALGILAPWIWLLLTAYLALYPAAFLAGYRVLLQKGVPSWAAAPAWWLSLEYLRYYVLSGFPWADLGTAQYHNRLMLALAPCAGVWGLTWATVFINAAVYRLGVRLSPDFGGQEVVRPPLPRPHGGIPGRSLLWTGIAVILLLGAGYEKIQLRRDPGSAPVRVAALQGDIDQDQVWDETYRARTLGVYRDLIAEASQRRAELVVWPESAFPGIFNWDYGLAQEVSSWSRRWRVAQLVGSDTVEATAAGTFRYFNSLIVIGGDGRVAGSSSKRHLVPFGEYVPFRDSLLFFLRKVVDRYGAGNFTPGAKRQVLRVGLSGRSLKFGSLICFESLFPQYARELVLQGGQFLVVVTNDTWFGATAAPAQHAMFSALRAAETGRYLVRAAATGVSCIFGPDGVSLGLVPVNARAALVANIRPRTALTLYTRFGPWLPWLMLILCLWDFISGRRRPGPPR